MTHPARVDAIRRFNRFYTRQIGVLQEGLLDSPFSLAESRVLYELAHRTDATATELSRDLGLDAGYLSRMIRGFETQGFVEKRRSAEDGRQSHLALTASGRTAFAPLNERSSAEIGAMLAKLNGTAQSRLAAAMAEIEALLGQTADEAYSLRSHRPGDIGWVAHRHGALYHQEYGWDDSFEALVAEIGAQFIRNFDPTREHAWIAERRGQIVGSVFLVRQSDEVAKLRLLLVEPSARGLGLGRRLTEECIAFARERGYARITLWTNDVLTAARAIYDRAGFHLIASEPHHSFGKDLVGENWELEL
ncbi:MAG TPA: helix-turn-helix domain-containing GNAT family N-acetyltransferase [Aliidongia sp.]|uniref:bifunctional helix-turn-helix transcriptional regulator/GNAT family N-acetyltransferase n=1 Tax=Aliidongia sp. TaxID=1914230 RepID=UPI002DDD700D|nr:helix-turn-helix domain-containing GNAT family N-acetyltransferase [Aliidongia sp.]HEV2674308.1 helix-turn-helix domain-containing GNAT family N-acetyltransferase [Aliidongia sp.]